MDKTNALFKKIVKIKLHLASTFKDVFFNLNTFPSVSLKSSVSSDTSDIGSFLNYYNTTFHEQ